MKKSHFRIKIYFFKLFYFLPYFVAISVLQLIVFTVCKNSMTFYIFYPFVYIGLEAGVKGSSITYLWYLNIFIYFVVAFFLLEKKNMLRTKKYLACPYCQEMISVFYQWGCGKCKNFQSKDHYVTERCSTCGVFLKTFVCEHCEKEFRL